MTRGKRLLSLLLMLWTSINVKFLNHLTTQRSLGKHSLNCFDYDKIRLFLHKFVITHFLKTTSIT